MVLVGAEILFLNMGLSVSGLSALKTWRPASPVNAQSEREEQGGSTVPFMTQLCKSHPIPSKPVAESCSPLTLKRKDLGSISFYFFKDFIG